jgi:propionyl-CoA synthetase
MNGTSESGGLRAHQEAALRDPAAYWGEASAAIDWFTPSVRVLDTESPEQPKWFAGGTLNAAYNALDRHVAAGLGDRTAIVYDSPVTQTKASYTYAEVLDRVARFAGALRDRGVNAGDRVVIYMPVMPATIVAMLACARIGAIHSVVFGGFAARELASRIADAQPKAIVYASCGVEPTRTIAYKPAIDEAIAIAGHEPQTCIVLQRPMLEAELTFERDVTWDEVMAGAQPVDCVPVAANDPLYILYTSGTTGQPKGIVRETAGHLVSLQWSMNAVFGANEGDVFWAASDVGWVVGHSYIVYAPLLKACTTIMYEGKPVGTPDPGAFWRVASEHKVNVMFTAPTAIRAIRREDFNGEFIRRYDLSHLRTLFLAGERCDPPTLTWARAQLGIPVIDHWWQTETGHPMTANCVGFGAVDVPLGSAGRAVPGWDIHAVDEFGVDVAAGETGSIVARLPLPPGASNTLWNAPERYRKAYLERFPGFYQTGDAGHVDADGNIFVMTRTDDVINVAGHRLSTGAIEEVVASHPLIAECAVVGVADSLKGQVPVGFVVLKSEATAEDRERVPAEVIALVRQHMGAVVAFKSAVVVPRLPKTRSGKTLRATIVKIADAQAYDVPPTIEDASVLADIERAAKSIGLAGAGV